LTAVIEPAASVALRTARLVRRRIAFVEVADRALGLLADLGNTVVAAASDDDECNHREHEGHGDPGAPFAPRPKHRPAG
jgi:hypothetical protein